jgi:hypothetical protein
VNIIAIALQFPAVKSEVIFIPNFQVDSKAHPATHSVSMGAFSPKVKTAGV